MLEDGGDEKNRITSFKVGGNAEKSIEDGGSLRLRLKA